MIDLLHSRESKLHSVSFVYRSVRKYINCLDINIGCLVINMANFRGRFNTSKNNKLVKSEYKKFPFARGGEG